MDGQTDKLLSRPRCLQCMQRIKYIKFCADLLADNETFYVCCECNFSKVGRFASEAVLLEWILYKMFINPYLWIGGVCIA